MTATSRSSSRRQRFHPNAYQFVFAALRYAQERLGRTGGHPDDEDAHVSGPELLWGLRDYALDQFGLMTLTVFRHWGVASTQDFGRIVFELVERGEMRKTDRDNLEDFYDVYSFEDAFDDQYEVDTSQAFR